MAKTGPSTRAQVRGLLLRTVHIQKRDHCNNFCIFIFPSLLVILLAVIPSLIRGRKDTVKPFELDPRGATALRPFPPGACQYLERATSRADLEKIRRKCLQADNLFQPGYTLPVLAKPSDWKLLGSRNATPGATESPGLLEKLSLFPFVYPPAIPGSDYEFENTQTKYDGVVLHEVLGGNKLVFGGLADTFNNQTMTDAGFRTATRRLNDNGKKPSPLLDLLFDDWYKGSAIGKHFGAVSFESVQQTPNRTDVSATVFYNESQFGNVELSSQLGATLVALESSILSSVTNGTSSSRAFIRKMPKIVQTGPLPFVNLGLAIFIGLTFHFLLPTFLHFMVMERQNRIRGLMAMMGLTNRRYWLGSYLGFYIMYCISAGLVIICGLATKIDFFRLNTPLSYLLLFFIWGHNLIAFAVLLAPFFQSADTALVIGWLYVILVNIVGGPYLGRRLGSGTSESSWASIMLLPSFAFLRSVYYVGAINEGGKGVVVGSAKHLGVELGMCRGQGSFCRSYVYLAVEWIIFMVLGLYFDRVLPGAVGGRQHPLFFLGYKRGARAAGDATGADVVNDKALPGEAADVHAESEKAALMARESVFNPVDGVVVSDLKKAYYTGGETVQAVKGISFVAEKGEIMGILGHNGAGKTTMFKMLVGEIEPTGGEAHVFGFSIGSDMTSVHENMGVTPQENILWPDLSIEEHLFFYGRLKGLSGSNLKESVEKSLEHVDLAFARKRLSSKCSGGMKRRLAVAISMTGNPSFIALDEPR